VRRQFIWVCILCLLGWPTAFAQVLGDLEEAADQGVPFVRIHFTGSVQLIRHTPVGHGSFVQVFFRLVSPQDTLNATPNQESRSSPARGGVPAVTVTFPVQSNSPVQRLDVQFDRDVAYTVRTSPDSRSIDFYLTPAGQTATPGAAPATEPPAAPSGPAPIEARPLPPGPPATATPAPPAAGAAPAAGGEQPATAPGAAPSPPAPGGEAAQPAPAGPPAPAPGEAAPAAPVPAASPEVEAKATDLMNLSRDALAAGRNDDAINLLNQLLVLPPNRSSQDAQELIGLARERAGEINQARQEYELYLRLYPSGEGTDRVRQRLAALPAAAPAQVAPPAAAGAPAAAAPPPPAGGRGLQANGSISQYYYGGNEKNDTLINVPTGVDRTTLSGTTQSAIVSNVDLAARYRTDDTETRLTFRDTNTHSFLQDVSGSNLFNVGNVEFRDFPDNYTVRLGRLAGGTTGVLGRYDGASVTWGFSPKWRLNAAGGSPVNYLTNARGTLEAVGIESDEIVPSLGGSLYAINQTTQGYVDRRAVGTELRYFNGGASLFSTLDYDVAFREFNIVTIQGTYLTSGQTTFTALWDERKAPPLSLSNALIGTNYTSIRDLIQQLNLSVEDVRNLANDTSALAKQGMVGVSKPLSPQWQLGVDLRYANVGPLPAIPDLNIAAQPSTGNQYTANLTASGSNVAWPVWSGPLWLMCPADKNVNTFVLTYLESTLEKGEQFAYNCVNLLGENKTTIEPSFRFYHQTDNEGNATNRYSPGFRVSYRVNQSVSLEATVLAEITNTTGPTQTVKTSDYFYFFGYRYDLR